MMAHEDAAPRLRIARATHRLRKMTEFYHRDLGLPVAERFDDHAGYTGVILEVSRGVELEITVHARGRIAAMPDHDDLLVLYLPPAQLAGVRDRMERRGHASVRPLNPYWLDKAVTFEDPDGWRLVLCNHGTPPSESDLRPF